MTSNFLENSELIFSDIFQQLGMAWWIEVVTNKPYCIYYFGPFATAKNAKIHQAGYINDLLEEEAEIVLVNVKQCQPQQLTIDQPPVSEKLESNVLPQVSNFTPFCYKPLATT